MVLSRRSWRTFAALAFALAACHSAGRSDLAGVGGPERAAAAPPTPDPGAPVLAAAQNARAAIAAGDRVAAFNDVTLALSDATRLAGAESALYPPEGAPPGYGSRDGEGGGGPGGPGRHRHGGGGRGAGSPPGAAPASGPSLAEAPPPAPNGQPATAQPAPGGPGHHRHNGGRHGGPAAAPTQASAPAAGPGERQGRARRAGLSAFDLQVTLVSAQTRLQTGDAAGADALLGAIDAAAPPQLVPSDLPLIRADQALTLASAAVSGGRLAELTTQLAAARAALEAYQGEPHAADARALAAMIGETLQRPGGLAALQPAQLALWSARADGWVGSGRV